MRGALLAWLEATPPSVCQGKRENPAGGSLLFSLTAACRLSDADDMAYNKPAQGEIAGRRLGTLKQAQVDKRRKGMHSSSEFQVCRVTASLLWGQYTKKISYSIFTAWGFVLSTTGGKKTIFEGTILINSPFRRFVFGIFCLPCYPHHFSFLLSLSLWYEMVSGTTCSV